MTATEARAAAEKYNKSNHNHEYNTVMAQINISAKAGAFCVSIYKNLQSQTIEALTDNGYKVTDLCDNIRNEPLYKIEW